MNNKYYQSLQAILTSIDNIENFIGTPKIYENYESNLQLQQAVERNLEIIGEATKRLVDINPEIQISHTRAIINTRNKIIHGYDEIENVQIWGIILKYLPVLRTEVSVLLENNNL